MNGRLFHHWLLSGFPLYSAESDSHSSRLPGLVWISSLWNRVTGDSPPVKLVHRGCRSGASALNRHPQHCVHHPVYMYVLCWGFSEARVSRSKAILIVSLHTVLRPIGPFCIPRYLYVSTMLSAFNGNFSRVNNSFGLESISLPYRLSSLSHILLGLSVIQPSKVRIWSFPLVPLDLPS